MSEHTPQMKNIASESESEQSAMCIPLLVSDQQIAAMLGCSRRQIWRLAAAGILPAPHRIALIGTRWRYGDVAEAVYRLTDGAGARSVARRPGPAKKAEPANQTENAIAGPRPTEIVQKSMNIGLGSTSPNVAQRPLLVGA